jgi:hypothetical protein
MKLDAHFAGLLGRIEPDDDRVSKAKKAHEELRKHVEEHPDVRDAHRDTYLSGSYKRHTAIKNIKDVDVICVVDIDKDKNEPLVVLRWLEGAMLDYYKDVRLQGRSIRITTADGFDLDLVPGSPWSRADGPLWIPDREASKWVATHPQGQIQYCVDRNDSSEGFYVQTVKLLKHWRDRIAAEAARPKSYVLESLCAKSMSALPRSHAHAVVSVLDGITETYGTWVETKRVPTIADPGYPSVNVAKRWTAVEFDAFMNRVKSDAVVARLALTESDVDKSVALWRRLFGTGFAPEP